MCTQSEPFCKACRNKGDCFPEASLCDPGLGCVECRSRSDCPANETCTLIHRCAKICKSNIDCDDLAHQLCETDLEACVSCKKDMDCLLYAHGTNVCYNNACVECYSDSQCASQVCIGGRCLH
jgi:hypothetical protein